MLRFGQNLEMHATFDLAYEFKKTNKMKKMILLGPNSAHNVNKMFENYLFKEKIKRLENSCNLC